MHNDELKIIMVPEGVVMLGGVNSFLLNKGVEIEVSKLH
jgi:hypothetical protein